VNNVGEDLSGAEAGAMKRCKEKNKGACIIKFTDCSLPVFEYF